MNTKNPSRKIDRQSQIFYNFVPLPPAHLSIDRRGAAPQLLSFVAVCGQVIAASARSHPLRIPRIPQKVDLLESAYQCGLASRTSRDYLAEPQRGAPSIVNSSAIRLSARANRARSRTPRIFAVQVNRITPFGITVE